MTVESILEYLGSTWHGWENWVEWANRLDDISKSLQEPVVVLDAPVTHPINSKTQYYRLLSRMAAEMIWREYPDLKIVEIGRKISLWLESTYGVRYDYNNSIYRWIRPLAPYEPPPTNKPRK